MELGVLLLPPLDCDVAPDFAFATMPANRADVEPVGPELAAPEVLFDRWHPAEHLPGGETLDHPDELRRAVRRDCLHEEVHVIPVRPNLQKRDLVPCGNLQTDVPEDRVHLCREHGPAVLRGTDDMVEQNGDIVAAVDVLTHVPQLTTPDAASRGE